MFLVDKILVDFVALEIGFKCGDKYICWSNILFIFKKLQELSIELRDTVSLPASSSHEFLHHLHDVTRSRFYQFAYLQTPFVAIR